MPKKHILYIVFIVVFVFAYQYSGSYFLQGENELIESFNKTDFDLKEAQVSVWGLYNKTFMTLDNKWKVLEGIAEELDLQPMFKYEEISEGAFKEVKLIKQSKYSQTVIKLVTMENDIEENVKEVENYLIIDLTLYRDIDSVVYYKRAIEDLFKGSDIKHHVSLNITGQKEGMLSNDEKSEMVKLLFGYVQAKKQEQFTTEGIYSVYGYSPIIDDYINSNGKKINVDLAFTYNEKENLSYLYLATPIITVSY